MSDELSEFEQSVKREIDAFMKPGHETSPAPELPGDKRPGKQPSKPTAGSESAESYRTGHLVRLAVRTRKLEVDTVFEHRSTSISKLEAQLEAEKAAKQAGYPIIGYVIDIQSL
ncbi:MAG: hypothetical protein LPK08_18095 [Halomonas sp.]|uniref:Uncharacterized protein n=2 Tax=Halomonadaceae TaxID=28256 RepID=A0ABS6ZUH3_9GAMM|nr:MULTISPECIES: hypothetical protein [Halomonas]MBW6392569.1 hypothetical protein [Halomonas antri]MDX5379421.1 hypothetical protein [Halomonas sp.]QTP57309.1 hypothetical protein HNO53_00405 [Halomonas sulfidivorans]